jgi:hypothetical protein
LHWLPLAAVLARLVPGGWALAHVMVLSKYVVPFLRSFLHAKNPTVPP